jgi:hypothetical protein
MAVRSDQSYALGRGSDVPNCSPKSDEMVQAAKARIFCDLSNSDQQSSGIGNSF